MTYAGEAVGLDFANVITGSPFADYGEALRWKYDGGTATLTAGDSFIAGFFDSATLVSGEVVEFTFVVSCVAGSSGTLRLSGGTDPDFTLDDPADASVSLGTFAVTGAQTVQSGTLPRDVDDYLTQAVETIVYVECLSGTVVVDQVKLYIHPVGGPVGAWVVAPGFTATVAPDMWTVGGPSLGPGTTFTAAEPVGPYESAADELVARWGAASRSVEADPGDWVASSALAADVFAEASVAVQTLIPLDYAAGDTATAAASIAQRTDPEAFTRSNTPTYGESSEVAFSPYEVPGDLGVQLLGSPSTAWGDALLTGNPARWDLIKSGAGYTLSTIPDDSVLDASGVALPSGYAVALPGSPPTDLPVSMPDARTVMLSVSADILTAPAPYSADNTNGDCDARVDVGIGITLADSVVTVPSYRYWSPTAVVVPPLRQRNRGRVRSRLRADRQRSIRSRGFL